MTDALRSFMTSQTRYNIREFTGDQELCLIVNNVSFNPLRPNNDQSQTSHYNIKGLSGSKVMRIENMITQFQFY